MLSTLQILKLGLVAKTLLVAISLHALSALMLANFRLTTFFKASHGSLVLVRVDQLVIAGEWRKIVVLRGLEHDF